MDIMATASRRSEKGAVSNEMRSDDGYVFRGGRRVVGHGSAFIVVMVDVAKCCFGVNGDSMIMATELWNSNVSIFCNMMVDHFTMIVPTAFFLALLAFFVFVFFVFF